MQDIKGRYFMKKKRQQGVLTVEASIVLTLLILLVLFLFSFGRVYRAQSLVSHATLQAADAVALESYLRETALQSDASDVLYLASSLTDSTSLSAENLESLRSADIPKVAREKFITAVSNSEGNADEKLKNLGVKDGISGIDFSECKVDLGNDDVIVAITYTIEMQFPVFGADELTVTKSAKAKTFGEILFEVATEPNVPGWGTTSGDSKVVHGTTVEITATPNYGYKFVSWDDGVTDNPRTVTVTDALHYKAIFEKKDFGVNVDIDLEVQSEDLHKNFTHKDYGHVIGEGTYKYLDVVTLTAEVPNANKSNYYFAGWDDNGDGEIDNTNAIRPITVDKTYNIKAIFKPTKYTITVKANNSTYGTAQVQQGTSKGNQIKAEYGSSVQLVATSKDNVLYSFSKWSNSNTEETTTVQVNGNQEYIANFILNTCTITFYNGTNKVHTTTVIKGSSIDGSKSLTGCSMYNGSINSFSRWKKSDNSTFTSQTKVNSNLSVYAVFNYTVTLNPNKGSVSWTKQTKEVGNSVKLPTPTLSNHKFKGWKDSNENVYEAGKSYAFSSNITLTAKWECDHKVGTLTGNVYEPYCREIYSGGKLKAGASLPWKEYKCETCGDTWKVQSRTYAKHYRMNYKKYADGGTDDFQASCNTKHPDTHYGYCGKYWSNSGSRYHNWDGYYHVLCSYCYKEEQGFVWCYVDGELLYYDLHKCAKHNTKGSHTCPVK